MRRPLLYRTLAPFCAAAVLAIPAAATLSAGPFELSAPLKDGGGGIEAAGGELSLQGGAGQSALPAQRPRGGAFELRRGFFDPPKLRLQAFLAYELRGPGGSALSLPAGSVDRPTFDLAFRRDPVGAPLNMDPAVIAAANEKMVRNGGPLAAVGAENIWDVSLHDEVDFLDGTLLASAMLSLPYRDADGDGMVDGTSPPVRVNTLELWRLDEKNALWVRDPSGRTDPAEKSIRAPLSHLSVFALIGGADTKVNPVYAYPVPFRPNGPSAGVGPGGSGTEAAGITFTNLPTEGVIEIFTLDGRFVRRLTIPVGLSPAALVWDVKNENGVKVASSVYLWRVVSGGNQKIGKLMVIR